MVRTKEVKDMIKFLTVAVALVALSFVLSQHVVFGQTATPTTSPSPTVAVPTSAPATGFGPY